MVFSYSQEKAAKWKNPDGHMDGLTTNGVLVMHPRGGFTEESQPGVWREISVCGDVYTLRETRSAQQRGKLVSRLRTGQRDCSSLARGRPSAPPEFRPISRVRVPGTTGWAPPAGQEERSASPCRWEGSSLVSLTSKLSQSRRKLPVVPYNFKSIIFYYITHHKILLTFTSRRINLSLLIWKNPEQFD